MAISPVENVETDVCFSNEKKLEFEIINDHEFILKCYYWIFNGPYDKNTLNPEYLIDQP